MRCYLSRATNRWANLSEAGNGLIRERIVSYGRKDISIIGCEGTNAARSFQQSWITSGIIRWSPVCVRERKTGLGLLIHSHAKVDRLVLKTMPVESPQAQGIRGGEAAAWPTPWGRRIHPRVAKPLSTSALSRVTDSAVASAKAVVTPLSRNSQDGPQTFLRESEEKVLTFPRAPN